MVTENKKIKNASPLEYKNIKFKSKLEVAIFKTLEDKGLNPKYEEQQFELISGWSPKVPFYVRNKKTKKLTLDNKKIISIRYTPDIVFKWGDHVVYVEVKGMENDVYYLKKKLFRRFLENTINISASNSINPTNTNTPHTNTPIYAEIKSNRELLELINVLENQYKL